MSRLFEALQKSEPDLSFDFPLAMQLTDELLKPAETESPQKESEEFDPSRRPKQDFAVAPELDQPIRSAPVIIKPDARPRCLTEQASLPAAACRFRAVRLGQRPHTRAVKTLL